MPRWLAPAGTIGPVVLNLVLWIEGARRPGYDWVSQFVSELSLGNRGWLQKGAFMVGGIGVCVTALGIHAAFDRGRWRGASLWLVASGGCLCAAGIFDTDRIPVHLHFLTLPGLLHAVTAFFVFAFLVAAAVDAGLRFELERGWKWFSLVTAALVSIAVLLVIAGFPVVERPASLTVESVEAFVGVSQRVAQALAFIWLTALSFRALAEPGRVRG